MIWEKIGISKNIPGKPDHLTQEYIVELTEVEFESAILYMWDSSGKEKNSFFDFIRKLFKREEYEKIPIILDIIKKKRNCKINIIYK